MKQPMNKNFDAITRRLEHTVLAPSTLENNSPFFKGTDPSNWSKQKENRNIAPTIDGIGTMLGLKGSAKGEAVQGDAARHSRYCVKAGQRRPGCPICLGRKEGDGK